MTRSKIRTSGAEGLTLSSTSLTVANGLTLTDGNITLASGHGLDLSATSDGSGTDSSEILDDYEEGTWVPTLSSTTSSSYDGQQGNYTKIGRFVAAHFRLEIGDTFAGGTTQYLIGGLPYASENTSGIASGSGFAHYFENISQNANNLTMRVDYGQSVMYISGRSGDYTNPYVNFNILQAQANIYGSVFYYTAS